jgi:hypothetical protein
MPYHQVLLDYFSVPVALRQELSFLFGCLTFVLHTLGHYPFVFPVALFCIWGCFLRFLDDLSAFTAWIALLFSAGSLGLLLHLWSAVSEYFRRLGKRKCRPQDEVLNSNGTGSGPATVSWLQLALD